MTTTRPRRGLLRGGCALLAAVLAGLAAPAAAEAHPRTGGIVRVSVGLDGAQPDGASAALGLSADGRYALFSSDATNLVPGDTNGATDVFVRDLHTGRTQRVSVGADGAQLDAPTTQASISGDGRFVAFNTKATNVVPGHRANSGGEVYLRDLRDGVTELITAGDPAATGQDGRISRDAVASWDGRFVAFSSSRTDLAPVGTFTKENIYVTDRREGTTRLVTLGVNGKPGNGDSYLPSISADGRVIGFKSRAYNLLPAPTQSPAAPAAPTAPEDHADHADSPAILGHASYPFYVFDQHTGVISGASTDPAGLLANTGLDATLSPDGRYAVYTLEAPGGPILGRHQELYTRDLRTGTVTRVTTPLPGTTTVGSAGRGTMSYDDRWVYFVSDAGNLVPGVDGGQQNVFRRDLVTGAVELAGAAEDGTTSTGTSDNPYTDASGSAVLFTSEDGTLLPGDTNHVPDVFLRRLLAH
ncbi:TolB family protein [Kitasatospora sp. NPDC087271]|uniref:TolB family protein n=1 Tax=Kitasatospora sp. NPDC087271 TaxID=3364067 RepID=UPI0037F35FBD